MRWQQTACMVIAPPVPETFLKATPLRVAWERVSARAHWLDESLRTAAAAPAVERVAQTHQQGELCP